MRSPALRCLIVTFLLCTHCAYAHDGSAPAKAGTTAAAASAAPLTVTGEIKQPLTVDAALLRSLPRERVEALDHGKPGTWEGVKLAALLEKAGAPLGDALRGRNLAGYVLVSAADGYRVVFALAEFDAAFGASGAILADTRDGKPLDAHEGPYRIIVPAEKRPGRWVRQVQNIELRFASDAAAK